MPNASVATLSASDGTLTGAEFLRGKWSIVYVGDGTCDARCREADILVAAVGRTKMIRGSWVKPGAVVIDVGMNRDENGKLCGDVDFDGVKEKAAAITPVPGGVGPMTITMLLYNTVASARRAAGLDR